MTANRIALIALVAAALWAPVLPPRAMASTPSGRGTAADSLRSGAPDSTVYLDAGNNVHVLAFGGKDTTITKDGRYRDPKLSPDGRTVGMLVTSTLDIAATGTNESLDVAEALRIVRGGRVIRRFTPGGYIRAWDFANQGTAVAVYSGALHFAGFYVLYDLERGTELAKAEDPVTDSSPDWVRALAP